MKRLRAVLVALPIALVAHGAGWQTNPDVIRRTSPQQAGFNSEKGQTSSAFFFLQFSDPQFGMFTDNRDFVQETANFEFAVATANRLHPAFLIVTGDLVNKPGDTAQIAEYHRIAAKLNPSTPLYNVAGNHDVENVPTPESVAAYIKEFGPDRTASTTGSSTASCWTPASSTHPTRRKRSLLHKRAGRVRSSVRHVSLARSTS